MRKRKFWRTACAVVVGTLVYDVLKTATYVLLIAM